MILFPNAKINIGLQVLNKRPDGYHNLQSIFYPIPKSDILEIIPQPANTEDSFTLKGIELQGHINSNLCIKAIQLLRKDYPQQCKNVASYLYKIIPAGGGLGGGSSDGTFMLIALNKLFNLELSESQLIQYALELGSDCPFFVRNKPSFVSGRGEHIQPIALDLKGYYLVLINPNIHISTAWAFGNLSLEQRERFTLTNIVDKPIEKWQHCVENDFEKAVFESYPTIAQLKNDLYGQGALYAQMSGTGSSVYGIFRTKPDTSLFPENYSRNLFQL